jgi:hypothetical protein
VDPLLLLLMSADDNRVDQRESMDVTHEASSLTHGVSRVHFDECIISILLICITYGRATYRASYIVSKRNAGSVIIKSSSC